MVTSENDGYERELVSTPVSSRTPSGTDQCWPCTCYYSLEEFICASTLDLEGLVSLLFSIPLGFYALFITSCVGFPEP